MNLKQVLSNVSYTLSSNLLSLFVSILVTLLLPKLLGVESYGYFQLYLFYTSYVGFLHLGWCDGIYLRYGGEEYEKLDYSLFKGQYLMLVISQLLLTVVFILITLFSDISSQYKVFVLVASSLNIVILNVRTFTTLILQTTNRIKDYSMIIISDRLIYVILVMFLLAFKSQLFYYYIIADVVGKLISTVISLIKTKELVRLNQPVSWDFYEVLCNIKVGINLMFANIASMLVIGIIRFGIQKEWDVATFGKISLTLSISNMLMVFVNAISLAIFPLLKRTEENEYANVYKIIRTVLMPLVFVSLAFYYPLNYVLIKWLPLYSESLKYMAIVFPIVVFECKVSLLTNTYLKALRKEQKIFLINVFTAILSLCFTFIFVFMMKNLFLSMLSIVVLLGIRSSLAEIALARYLDIDIYKEMFLEYLLIIIFITSNWIYRLTIGSVIYVLAVLVYLFSKKESLKIVYKQVLNK